MPIVPGTVNDPVLSDALARAPFPRGTHQGEFVLPRYQVTKERVKYIAQAEHSLNLDDLRAARAQAKMVEYERGALTSVSLEEHAFKTRFDQREIRAYLDAPDLNSNIVDDDLNAIRGDIADVKEYNIASVVTTAASFDASNKKAAASFKAAGILANHIEPALDEIADDAGFDTGIKMVIGRDTFRILRQNPDIQAFATGGRTGTEANVSLQVIAEYLGVQEVRVARYRRKLGNDAAYTEFWPLDFALLFLSQPTLSDRTFGVTAVLAYESGLDIDVRRSDLPGVEQLVEVGAFHTYAEAVLNFNAAYLFTGITSV